jgi:hypothetical protein
MKRVFFTMLCVICVAVSFAQKDSIPTLRRYKVNSGKDFITVEFYSLKSQMYSGYEVWRTDGDKAKLMGTFGKKYTVGTDTIVFFYTDTNVVANKLYQYAFVPIKEREGKQKPGQPVFASTKVFTAYYFYKMVATANKQTLAINVKWHLSSIDNIKAVRLYRSEFSDTGFVLLATLPSTDTLYVDDLVVPDKPYFYRLSAENHITKEVFESASFFDLGMPTSKPLKPTVQNVVQTDKGVEVKIDVSEPYLAAVHLYRKVNGADKFALVTTANADSVVFILDSAANNLAGHYVYVATTENAARFESDYSNEAGVYIASKEPAEYGGDFTADFDKNMVKLFWEKQNVTLFKVKRFDVEANKAEWLNEGAALSANRLVDSTILPARTYEYTLYPLTDNGVMGRGVSVILETPDDELVTNQSLQGFSTTQGIVLEWGVLADVRVAAQKLYRTAGGGQPVALATLEMKTGNYKDTTAMAGEIYRYYLVSVDSKGKESQPGNEIAVRAQQK